MALPQSVDPTTLNLTGKPAIATGPTVITSQASTGMPNTTIAQEKSNVSPLLGALFGAGLGYKASMANQGNAGANTSNANQPGKVNIPTIPKIPGGSTGSGTIGTPGGTATGGGSTGSIPSISFPPGTTQQQIDDQYGKTNGQSNYVITGPNMTNGSIVAQPNTMIPGYTSTGTGSGPSDTATPPADQTAGTYFQDSYGNIYDPNGNLYAVNYNGDYFVSTGADQWTDVNTGASITSSELYGGGGPGGYTGGGYDENALPTDITGGGGYDPNSIFDYSPIDTGTVVKDGGLITMMKRGGGVKHFVGGGPADATVDNTAPPPPTDSTSIIDSVLGFAKNNPMLSGAALGGLLTQLINSNSSYSVNKGVDMSALGSLKSRTTPAGPAKFVPYSDYGTPTAPYDYSTLYNNLGVSPFNDGSAAPTTPGGTTSSMPAISTPTTPTGGLPTTTPTAPTSPVVTPPAATTPTYYSDADGNIYDSNGDLVYDTTTSSVTGPSSSPISSFAATSSAPSSGLAVPSLPVTTAADAAYSYGTPVTPASVLGSKKGGLAVKKMADGGSSGLSVDAQTLFDTILKNTPNMEASDLENLIATDPYRAQAMYNAYTYKDPASGMQIIPNSYNPILEEQAKNYVYPEASIQDIQLGGSLYNMGENPIKYSGGMQMIPNSYDAIKEAESKNYVYPNVSIADIQPGGQYYNIDGNIPSYNPVLEGIKQDYVYPKVSVNDIQPSGQYYNIDGNTPLPYERTDVSTTSTGTDFPPIMYNQGMPTQGNPMPTQGPLTPQQGPAMPQQPSFSSSPTFRFSGENNPLLRGLSQNSRQPYTINSQGQTVGNYADGGAPAYDNLNIPHEVGGLPTPQEMTGQDVPMVNGRKDYRNGNYVEGPGDGQSDDIPAMLADGEYVIDAETVAQLGNGSNKAGAKILDGFRKNIRAHKRSAPHDKIPPKSKSPLAYLKGAK